MSNNGQQRGGVRGISRPKRQSSNKRVRRSSKLQQIRECTITAVSHLAEKLSPVNSTPHLALLNEMCSNFISKRDSNIFELLETKQNDQKSHNNKLTTKSHKNVHDLSLQPRKSSLSYSQSARAPIPGQDINNESSPHGIGEIGVSYIELKPEKPPEHYKILSRSVSKRHSGNLAKHGARKTYLFYRNVNENEKPITAIALIDTNNGDEVCCLYTLK